MEIRTGKVIKAADMVVVHVGQDHVAYLGRIDSKQRQSGAWAYQKFTLSLDGHLRQKPGVNDDGPVAVARHPDKIIHAHCFVMRVAADKMVTPRTHPRRTRSARSGVAVPIGCALRLYDRGGVRHANDARRHQNRHPAFRRCW
jgi:hypothetical protein